jgi:hypothetical protein
MGKVALVMTSGERVEIDDSALNILTQKMGKPIEMWAPVDVGSIQGADQIVPAHITRIQRTAF